MAPPKKWASQKISSILFNRQASKPSSNVSQRVEWSGFWIGHKFDETLGL